MKTASNTSDDLPKIPWWVVLLIAMVTLAVIGGMVS